MSSFKLRASSLKGELAPDTSKMTTTDKFTEIQGTMTEGLLKLSQQMLGAIEKGDIEFNSTADIKNLVTAIQALRQDSSIASDTTPQITGDINNFFNQEFHLPEGTQINSNDVASNVAKMSAEEINKLMEKREVVGNNENVKQM